MLIKEAYAFGAQDAWAAFSLEKLAGPPMAMGRFAPHAPKGAPNPMAAGGSFVTPKSQQLRSNVQFAPKAPAGAPATPAAGAPAAPQGLWDQTKALGGRAMQGWENFSAQNPATAGLVGQLGTTAAMMAIPMMMSRSDR